MKKLVVVIVVLAVAGVVSEVRAEQFSLKIVGSAQPSCWSLEEIVQEVTAGAKTDREKALALHKFGMAHQIHFVGPRENGNYLVDALKILGVYGYSLCGKNSATMWALYNLAGMEARKEMLSILVDHCQFSRDLLLEADNHPERKQQIFEAWEKHKGEMRVLLNAADKKVNELERERLRLEFGLVEATLEHKLGGNDGPKSE